ncbi:MAG: tryptophan 7-halogenase [Vicinamibacterales bacterium]|nr:tryptophan 7-halogenase [Vicinamibacterales bacterium]
MTPDPILIAGGGPAGCAAAQTLARLGHRVRLVTRPAPDGGARLAVSIPPSGAKIFDLIGVTEAVDAAGFVRTSGNTAWWGGDRMRVEPFAAGARGWQAEVAALSRVLLASAAAAGVTVESRAFTSEEARAATAQFVLDCTGRAGVLAREPGVRVPEPGLRSVAMVGVWQRAGGWPVPDDTHTLIESYEDGWAWSVPVGSGMRHVAVMVDPRRSALARGQASVEVYRRELAKAPRFHALVGDAVLQEGPWGWDASMYHATRYVHGHVLLVGDAGSFVDPLSSAGVRKALVSGWTAAVAVHTSLTRPAMRETALAYFEAREHRMYAGLRRLAVEHFATAAEGHTEPFWTGRQAPASGDDEETGEAHPEDEGRVREAFERIRRAPALALTPGPFRLEPRPAIRGHEVVWESRLVTERTPEGLRYLQGVDIVRLIELAPAHAQAPDLFEAYCAHEAPVDLAVFLTVLATAVARGWLV